MGSAIRVESVGKRYRVPQGGARAEYQTLRESLALAAGRLRRGARAERAAAEEFWALTDVSFEVQPGEVVGIIGRNGAGKSTLLKILSRITKPTTGRIELNGRVGSLLEVGTGFHPELTGRENVYLNGSILGMSRAEVARKFDEIVAFAGVEKFLDTPVKRYSSGMYVRLAFAVAAHLEPEILIVDEVLAVGDAEFQSKCLRRISETSRAGRTVLFVSHTMPTVVNLCGRAVWMDSGSVRQVGPTRSVVDEYILQSIKATPSLVDLRSIARHGGMGETARITAIEWLCPLPLRHGESARLRLHYTATTAVQAVAAGVGFCMVDGGRFLTLDSDFAAPRRDIPVGGSGWVELHIPDLPLAPGRYTVDVGLRSGDRASRDGLAAVVQLEVVPGPTTPTFVMQHFGAGVRLGGEWSWG